MRLTTKGRFAVTALLDVAMHHEEGPVSLSAISERRHISLSYLEQLFSKLRKAGLVASLRGPGGGYSLNKPLHEISVAAIVHAVDDSLDATQCNGKSNCMGHTQCLTHDLWENLNKTIGDYLSGITLATLIEHGHNKQRLHTAETHPMTVVVSPIN